MISFSRWEVARGPWWTARHAFGRVCQLGIAAGAFCAAVWFKVPLCAFAAVTHQPCPGCGLTRATVALLLGDFGTSFHFHPLAIIVAPLAAYVAGVSAWSYVRTGRLDALSAGSAWPKFAVGLAVSVALIAVWVSRFFGAFGGPVPV